MQGRTGNAEAGGRNSATSSFTRKEPLTRIRDIAHRNDIPKELKKEIKNTLQNKLHRCAGLEDLATSAALRCLAGLRFKEAGLGTEFYAATPVELDRLLKFKPKPETPAVAHLRRDINLFEEEGRNLVMDFATKFKNQIFGLVIHDQTEITTRFDDYVAALHSPFGISDHLSFLVEIPIPFEYKDRRSLDPMFGPSGLSRIVTESLQLLGPDRVSFTLEIHPTEGRLPLANADYLFNHWRDKTNAERMNYWLSLLVQNHKLLFEACKKAPLNEQ